MAKGNVLVATIAGAVGLGAGILLGRTVLAPSTRPSGKSDPTEPKEHLFDLPLYQEDWQRNPLDECVSAFRALRREDQVGMLRQFGAPEYLSTNILWNSPGAVEGALLWVSQLPYKLQLQFCSSYPLRSTFELGYPAQDEGQLQQVQRALGSFPRKR